MGQKRRRLALSCVACRRRKVKCDRTFPTCNRCQKGNVACDYVAYTGKSDEPAHTPGSEGSSNAQRAREVSVSSWAEDANTWQARAKLHSNTRSQPEASASITTPSFANRPPNQKLLELQERVFELETYVRAAGSRPVSSEKYLGMGHPIGPGASQGKRAFQEHERALLRGKSFKTQYFGPSHPAGILLQYEELSSFVKTILGHIPALEKARLAFKQNRPELGRTLMPSQFETLASMVPDQKRTDALVQEYFATIETTYRILHMPTFFQSYKEFWKSSSNVSAPFLAQLLLICACVNSAVEGGPTGFRGRSSASREMSVNWLDCAEDWVDLQSQKHVTLEVFQVRTLVVLAKRLNCVKIKREWTMTGHLLRLAMSSGLHREPTVLSNRISVFDQEMRRRLWFTILEVETQSCLDRGMPATIHPFDWDCLPPLNIHDEDFDLMTEKMPPVRPMSEFTRTSFLCVAQQHLHLRLDMLSRINSIKVCLESGIAAEYDQKLRIFLDDIPPWRENPSSTTAHMLSRLLLYEFLLVIHEPNSASHDEQAQSFFTRAARRNAAQNTLKIYTEMSQSVSRIFSNIREDLFRACLALCHDIVASKNAADDWMQDSNLAVEMIGKAVDLMEARIRCLGQGFHSFWLGASALGLLRAKLSPLLPMEEFTKQTADRVSRLHVFMMGEQMAQQTPGSGFEEAAMSGASTLVGMSGNPDSHQASGQADMDFFGNSGQIFNVFSDTLFDFDVTDIWNTGGYPQF
ncbi:uncharacterized protein A1O9_04761 [Exophiala aquamarina CBS 119918]|uniref:Zn(2)-C6 fungal-type domain-containing protein n=1 Tax=Exophiala aquamarina CBS 119918 TaxID=1182545 RepID=A0A072PKQ2_9EURO|nr:uncharacterized protein A1O9_04761 [Exophiala aquamarina CBS 119918]KEF59913.1 hypothetical protein A1O9_04761 [Exophiala aquamarina CBS 119918]